MRKNVFNHAIIISYPSYMLTSVYGCHSYKEISLYPVHGGVGMSSRVPASVSDKPARSCSFMTK